MKTNLVLPLLDRIVVSGPNLVMLKVASFDKLIQVIIITIALNEEQLNNWDNGILLLP